MTVRSLGPQLFRPRPEASFLAYIPVAIVISLFGLFALEDGGVLGALLPYGLLFLVSVLQLKFRTLIGWTLLLAASLWYALEVAIHPEAVYGHYGEYVFFIACGLVPAAFLVYYRPRFKGRAPLPGATAQSAVSKH
jgi:hypothetical protein